MSIFESGRAKKAAAAGIETEQSPRDDKRHEAERARAEAERLESTGERPHGENPVQAGERPAAEPANTVTGNELREAGPGVRQPGSETAGDAHRPAASSVHAPTAGEKQPAGPGAHAAESDREHRPGGVHQPGAAQQPGDARQPHAGDAHRTGTGNAIPGAQDAGKLREQWREVQTMFVDDPRDAVTRADDLVSGALQRLTDGYAQRLQQLETRWSSGGEVDTEELRQALRGYRDLFDQLVTTASAGGATNI